MKLISPALILLPLLAAQIFAQPMRPKDDTASDFAQQAIAAYRRGDRGERPSNLRRHRRDPTDYPYRTAGWPNRTANR